jgi:hypothetical protein
MGIVETLRDSRAQKTTREGKREISSEEKKSGDDVRPAKRAARMLLSDSEQREPLTIAGVPVTMIEVEGPYLEPSTSSKHTYVCWDTHSLPPGPKIRDLPEWLSPQPRAAIKETAITSPAHEAADPPASHVSTSPPDQKEKNSSHPSEQSTAPFSQTPALYKRAHRTSHSAARGSKDSASIHASLSSKKNEPQNPKRDPEKRE